MVTFCISLLERVRKSPDLYISEQLFCAWGEKYETQNELWSTVEECLFVSKFVHGTSKSSFEWLW